MKLKQLCDAAQICCPAGREYLEIAGICTDSRSVRSNTMFVCIRGLHTDGHAFIAQAVENGAVCVLTDRYEKQTEIENVVFLQCADTRKAVAYLFHAWYNFPGERLKLIGVTGTNGKTSVTHMLRSVFEASMHRCGLIGTVGCEMDGKRLELSNDDPIANMTTPDPKDLYRILAEMEKMGAEYVIMEVSSHALALEKLAPLSFEVAIFTNLTPEHLDFHKSMDAYAAAKAILMQKAKLCITNADSAYAAYMQKHAAGRCLTCSTHSTPADYCAEEIDLRGSDGVRYRLRSLRTRLQLSCPIPGEFTVANSMQAAIAALELGCNPAVIKTALASLNTVKGRMEKIRLGVGAEFTVLIDYAHTPDALEKLLTTARRLLPAGGRLILLFGCGGDRDRSKRAMMGELATRLADVVIVTGDNSRSEDPMQIIREIVCGMQSKSENYVIPEREDAIAFAIDCARAKDLILLAGKGHEEYEITKTGKHPFSEKKIAIKAYEARMQREMRTGDIDTETKT